MDVTPREVKAEIDAGRKLLLVDVREQWEWDIAHIDGARHVPMGALPEAIATLPQDTELVLYCHHGSRSRQATAWLIGEGFKARNLKGGVAAWADEVEPDMERY